MAGTIDLEKTRYSFLDLNVDAIGMEDALDTAMRAVSAKSGTSYILFLNVDVMVKAHRIPKLKRAINGATLSLMDGKPPLLAARKAGVPLPEKISGSDFVPALLGRMAALENQSVFFLGGAEEVAKQAVDNVKKSHPSLGIAGAYAPPFGFESDAEEIAKIKRMLNDSKPDVVVLCFGCPKQEIFLYDHALDCEVPLFVCAGATIDFLAGNISRAPKWVSSCGLEWLYRFSKEPKRLFRRYFVDSWEFLFMFMKHMRTKKRDDSNG